MAPSLLSMTVAQGPVPPVQDMTNGQMRRVQFRGFVVRTSDASPVHGAGSRRLSERTGWKEREG